MRCLTSLGIREKKLAKMRRLGHLRFWACGHLLVLLGEGTSTVSLKFHLAVSKRLGNFLLEM